MATNNENIIIKEKGIVWTISQNERRTKLTFVGVYSEPNIDEIKKSNEYLFDNKYVAFMKNNTNYIEFVFRKLSEYSKGTLNDNSGYTGIFKNHDHWSIVFPNCTDLNKKILIIVNNDYTPGDIEKMSIDCVSHVDKTRKLENRIEELENTIENLTKMVNDLLARKIDITIH